jgi:hypothetical protein
MINVGKFMYQQKDSHHTLESIKNSEAGESIQAAIQARFVALNPILI